VDCNPVQQLLGLSWEGAVLGSSRLPPSALAGNTLTSGAAPLAVLDGPWTEASARQKVSAVSCPFVLLCKAVASVMLEGIQFLCSFLSEHSQSLRYGCNA